MYVLRPLCGVDEAVAAVNQAIVVETSQFSVCAAIHSTAQGYTDCVKWNTKIRQFTVAMIIANYQDCPGGGEARSSQSSPRSTTRNPPRYLELNASTAKLFQNAPNPFNQRTTIKYVIPESAKNASLIISSIRGNKIKEFNLIGKSGNAVNLNSGELSAGTYIYSLMVDDVLIDTKQMILSR